MSRIQELLARPQNRTTLYLMLNNAMGALTGLAFWLVLARFAGLGADAIGIGYAIVALGTTIGMVAKGGLDTALMRHVPGAGHLEARRLLRFGVAVGAGVAVVVSLVVGVAATVGRALPDVAGIGWGLVAAIACLLVVAWLQDAFFLAEGDAAATFRRNLVFSGGRLVLPLPVLALALPYAVPVTWALALVAAAMAGVLLSRRQRQRDGEVVSRRAYLRSAARNITGNAAEFLPGLLLAPLVLATAGATAAGHFGMAWTAAALLFLASAAIGRSTLTALVRGDPRPDAVRRGMLQGLLLLVPGIIGGLLLAPYVLLLFGADYTAATNAFRVLCISTLFVAPAYLYLAVLRAQDRSLPLTVFPAAMVVLILVLATFFGATHGLTGVAVAWLVANAPFGVYAAWRLKGIIKEVNHASALGRGLDTE